MIATCPERDLLRDYSNGMVPEDQSDELTAHLRDCPSCQHWLSETKDLDDSLVGQLRHSTVDDSFDQEPHCQSAMARALGALALDSQTAEADEVSLPSSIGDYEIVRRIGRGGMGNVYLAQHTKLDRTVAVKVLASHRLSDPRMHDRFEKEMRAVGSLSHPNIVTAHDARDVDGVALLVTEWIDGLNLKDILDRVGPLKVADASEIGVRIASALSYISSASLIHRDLKPSNVMINRDGEVKLLDLGLARLRASEGEHDNTATGQALGTADYVAPEQINDARDVDFRADMYSLGCTLYKLLSGRAPFEGDRYPTSFAKLTAHVSDQPVSLRVVASNVPAAVSDLVDQLLAKSPDDRPTSPDRIMETLRKHASGADLTSLVQTAMTTQPTGTQFHQHAETRAATKGFWQRRVPIAIAIASGLGGLILGWFAGVLITITHPDGSKTGVEVPKTSHTTISETGDVDVKLAGPNGVGNLDVKLTIPNGIGNLDVKLPVPQISIDELQPPDDSPLFDGIWKAETSMYRGQNAPIQSIENGSMVFHQNGFVLMHRSRPSMVGTWMLDSDLGRITLEGSMVGNPTRIRHKGIYRFHPGGKLQICINDAVHDDFPVTFESPRATNVSTVWFARIEMPIDGPSMDAFMQDPSTRELLHAVAMYNGLKSGVPPVALAQTLRKRDSAIFETQTRNSMKQLGLAFHNYHDTYKVFPASRGGRFHGKPKEGEPPCSWRVAILPFIEQNDLFEQYHFDEPWNSEYNLTLLEKMPEVYRRPGDAANSTVTGYVGFVGENTALGDGEPKRIRDMIDGTSNVVLLVEAKTKTPWTKPEDCPLSEIAKLGLLGNETLQALMADGAVRSFQPLSEESIRHAAIINDGNAGRAQTRP
jgi:tRNA A-37 threonylcarbamoyl transferase component Bud32